MGRSIQSKDYNKEFIDVMNNINNIAKGYGFKNGIDWACNAKKASKIGYDTYMKYKNCHDLRVQIAHGGASDINISFGTYSNVCDFEGDIKNSRLRNEKKDVCLPSGTFRGQPYVKTFNRVGADGSNYNFKFSIRWENNEYDNGKYEGLASGTGYFIHIDNAPYLEYAIAHPHEFHIIYGDVERYICWSKIIDNFEDANAIMYVWVNRYVEVLDAHKEKKLVNVGEIDMKANRKNVLPTGTFRSDKKRTITIKKSVYDEIISILGKKKPELGGMLGYSSDQSVIDSFVFDKDAKVNSVEYTPNTDFLNNVLNNEWASKGIYFAGFVHSHPGDYDVLSKADIEYAYKLIGAFDLDYVFVPIVTSSYAYKTSIKGYCVNYDCTVDQVDISIYDGTEEKQDKDTGKIVWERESDEGIKIDLDKIKLIEENFDKMYESYLTETENSKINSERKDLSDDDTFARIKTVIDTGYMSKCSIIGIGCGGARSFYESMARMGVGNFYLIDGDKSSRSNIASQNGYISEIGKYKPEVVKNRLLDINESVNVETFNFMLDDCVTDEFIEKNILSKLDKSTTLICAFTDSFLAQARASRIAQKHGIPFLSGQHHAQGDTSELVYWYPNVSKYSLREIAKSRYNEYQKGYKNTVTSVGSPIFNTTRLNALCEKIAVGLLLYHMYPDDIYCSFLKQMSDKNLILIKQKYLSTDNSLFSLFMNDDNSFFDEVTWINPEDIEDLTNIEFKDSNVIDTREIFNEKIE